MASSLSGLSEWASKSCGILVAEELVIQGVFSHELCLARPRSFAGPSAAGHSLNSLIKGYKVMP
jgi:hypothetical protein